MPLAEEMFRITPLDLQHGGRFRAHTHTHTRARAFTSTFVRTNKHGALTSP